MSHVSSTDVRLFVALANPEKTNIDNVDVSGVTSTLKLSSSLPTAANGAVGATVASARPASIVEEDAHEDAYSGSDSGNSTVSSSNSSDSDSESGTNKKEEEWPAPTARVTPTDHTAPSMVLNHKSASSVRSLSSNSSFSRRVQELSKAGSTVSLPSKPSRETKISPFATRSPALPPLPANAIDTTPSLSKEEKEEIMLEKQSVLLELERMKAQGITLSKQYTLSDRIDDMQFEVRRHLLNIDEQNTVQFMRDGMRLAFTGVEIANSKMGPFLDLDGWAAEVSKDISKYDSSLSRLYRKYWKRSAMSPEMELAVGILGSMGMHHFKKKFMGNVMGAAMGGGGIMGGLGNFTQNANKKNAETANKRAPLDSSDDEEGLPASFQ